MIWIILAFVLDAAIGDPQGWPHPVRWIGALIRRLENALRRTKLPLGFSGAVLAVLTVTAAGAAAHAVSYLPWPLDRILTLYLLFSAIAARSLCGESRAVIRCGDIESRRKRLSWIVSRDTQDMDDRKIRTSVLETISENSVDGVFAPLMYMALGSFWGLAAEFAMIYKAVSTLDSMVGYKNEKYRELGRVSARMDDLLNLLPARLSMPFVWIAGVLLRWFGTATDPIRAIRVFMRDRYKHASPNSALPMSMYAGVLGVQLGGPTRYDGVLRDKPYLGDDIRPPSDERIDAAVALTRISAVLILAAAAALYCAVFGGLQ